nr:hypothetical protein [Prevotella sp.]
YFSDYQDVHVSVYNESQGGELLRNVSVQLPQVVVLSGADDGDELRIELSSVSGVFDTFSVSATIEDGAATIPVNIVDRGGFRSTFTTTQNGSVAAIVYDSEGQFVNYYIHKKATLDVKGLPEGDYTLVTMAYDPVVSRLSNLQAFQDMGLQQNRDFLLRTFHVSPGILTGIDQGEVPVINIDELKIIHPSTTFSLSEQQVTVGDYVTVHARIKVKNEIAQNSWEYGNFRLLFDLPSNSRYLRGSLMIDGQLATPDYEEGRLLVNAEGLQEGKVVDVRFCFVAKELGEHTVSALVGYRQYDWQNGDNDYFSPVGAATYEAIPMKYHILTETTSNFIASGNGPTDAIVRAYEDGTLLGQTSIAGKVWSINVPLPNTYNLSLHNIYLECETKEGNIYTTPTTAVMVNFDINAVNRVTMIYPNAFSQKTEVCTWEFREPDTRVESYDYYPSSTAFTFLTEFLHNDTTEIDNVRLHVRFEDCTTHDYPAVFDEGRGCWVTAIEVLDSPPVSVAVSYDRKKNYKRVDRQQMDDFWQELETHVARQNQLAAIIASITDDNIDQKMAEAEAILGVSLSPGAPSEELRERISRIEAMSPEELSAELQSMEEELDDYLANLDSQLKDPSITIDIKGTYTLDDGTVITVADCSAYSEGTILTQGFKAVPTTDGSNVYMRIDGTHLTTVDFRRDYSLEMVCPEAVVQDGSAAQARASVVALANKIITFLKDVVIAKIKAASGEVLQKIADITKYLMDAYKYLDECEATFQATLNTGGIGFVEKAQAWGHLKAIRIAKTLTMKQMSHVRFASNLLAKLMILPNYYLLFQKYSKIVSTYVACDNSIPNPCPKMEGAAMNIRMMIDDGMSELLFYCLGDVAMNLTFDVATILGIGFSVETFGASLLVSAASFLFKLAAQWALDWAVESDHLQRLAMIRACIRNLECDEEDEPEEEEEGEEEPYTPDKKPLHDPSGFVCEAVESNRLEGVTATCFFKKEVQDMYGDKHEEVTIWDAENYGQVNPQLTDRDGMYA